MAASITTSSLNTSRCLAVAVEAAVRLLAAAAGPPPAGKVRQLPPGSRVMVFAGGPITKGEIWSHCARSVHALGGGLSAPSPGRAHHQG